jgi:capsule biosynthesis phosphatase
MINAERSIILDIDGTLCPTKGSSESYASLQPHADMVELVRAYKARGFYIILNTSRNMRTHNGNVGRINADTLKTLFAWLDLHQIPYDEVHVAKPWPGAGGFYVDDKAIRPSEFRALSYEAIKGLLAAEER